MRIRALTAYDGTAYAGWQRQLNATTIQGLIEQVLLILTKKRVQIHGAGRTDAGVHAKGQVFHFDLDDDVELSSRFFFQLLNRLNGLLPRDVRILDVGKAPPDFHARKSAKCKIYSYTLQTAGQILPFDRLYRLKVAPLCPMLLRKATTHFIGKRDFSSLRNQGSSAKTSLRTLYAIDVVEIEGGVRLFFKGSGFLYKMVRNCVGLLLEVTMGKRALESIDALLLSGDRTQSAAAAPALGLCLESIEY